MVNLILIICLYFKGNLPKGNMLDKKVISHDPYTDHIAILKKKHVQVSEVWSFLTAFPEFNSTRKHPCSW